MAAGPAAARPAPPPSRCPCGPRGGGEEAARGAALTVSLLAVDHPHQQGRVPGELRETETRTRPSLNSHAPPGQARPGQARPGPARPSPAKPSRRPPRRSHRWPATPPPQSVAGEPPAALTLMSGETCTGGIILEAATAAAGNNACRAVAGRKEDRAPPSGGGATVAQLPSGRRWEATGS